MSKDKQVVLDMTADGRFSRPAPAVWSTRIIVGAIVVAVVAGTLALAAFALWVALTLLPVALGAAVVAMVAIRIRKWRAGAAGGTTGPLRPL